MADQFETMQKTRRDPIFDWEAITPNDSTALARRPRAIVALGAGNIVMTGESGNDITIAVEASKEIPYSPVKVKSTNTTATNIYGLY